jgi:arylsulfatase A-like enzyme
MPRLEKIEKNSDSLKEHYSTGIDSPMSFRSIFSGQRPLKFNDYDELSDERFFFPEILRENGVYTLGINTNPFTSKFFGFDRGFDRFVDLTSSQPGKVPLHRKIVNKIKSVGPVYRLSRRIFRKFKGYDLPYVLGEEVTDKAIQEIYRLDSGPSFVWVHYMDVHEPFLLPSEDMGEYSGENYENLEQARELEEKYRQDQDMAEDLYDEGLSYVDRQARRLLDFIEESEKDFEVIVTSDHGEVLKAINGDILGHKPIICSKEQFHVPFVIRSEREIRAEDLTSHMDIAPTILDMFDIEIPDGFDGKSLFSSFERESLVVEAAEEYSNSFLRDYSTYELGVISDKGLTVDPSEFFENVSELRKEYDQKARIFSSRSLQ